MKRLQTAQVASPIGELVVYADGGALVGLEFAGAGRRASGLRARLERALGPLEIEPAEDPAGAVARLARFFAGEVAALDEQPVRMHGTAFEEKVWQALRRIPAGQTRSYGEVAREIGAPRAVRAVGAANGHNPIALFVPCHRVVAANGALHGYGGGLHRKRWLLDHEEAHAPAARSPRQLSLARARTD
jgi:methylated-DNA-[protein]-cysteine S-methyltransferase